MDFEAGPMIDGSDLCAIPDLRDTSLAKLAGLASDGDDDIRGVVARMADGLESPSRVPATIFNSAI